MVSELFIISIFLCIVMVVVLVGFVLIVCSCFDVVSFFIVCSKLVMFRISKGVLFFISVLVRMLGILFRCVFSGCIISMCLFRKVLIVML